MLRIAGFGCAVVMFGVATVEAHQSDQSLEAISRGLQKPQQVSLEIPPLVAIPQDKVQLGFVTLETPDTRGEFIKLSLPVGEFATGLVRKISKARYQRRERKARETVQRDLREFNAQQKAK
jgi:hypothetical protein